MSLLHVWAGVGIWKIEMSPGIHLLHKPEGPTSFSLVQQCMRQMMAAPGQRRRRMCHGGTLDPFASGLLLILVEPATRLFDYLHEVPKVYDVTVRWGIETDNGDLHGKVTFQGDSSGLNAEILERSLASFAGWQDQVPHATSAKRVDGERAYVLAHRGETVVMPASKVYLHEAHWLGHDLPNESRLRLTVRGGYYVRALARDLGRLIGCGAHLTKLKRLAIGPWNDPSEGQVIEVHGREVLPWAPSRLLSDQEVGDLRQEKGISTGEILSADWTMPEGFPPPERVIRGFHQNRFCFLLEPRDKQLGLITALRGGL